MALSKYCSDQCIITPISSDDEKIRQSLGFLGPQNYLKKDQISQLSGLKNHTSSRQLRAWLGDEMFYSYRKVTIHREPLDFLISQYFFRTKSEVPRTSFSKWIKDNHKNALENYLIAPTKGENRCDNVFFYHNLAKELSQSHFLPADFYSVFRALNLKGDFRDPKSREVGSFYFQNKVDTAPILSFLESLEPYDSDLFKEF